MIEPPQLVNEACRQAALDRLQILDTPPEERYDRLTRLASVALGAPIALVSLVDRQRQWFKSRQGLEAPETARNISFCGHALADSVIFEVPDASRDARFADNPLVTGAPHIRFYAGQPLAAPDGSRVGTLCIIDRQPRRLSDQDRHLLADLAALVERELRLVDLADAVARLTASEARLVQALDAAETATRAKSAFLAHVSHELRTPMNAIIGFAELLEDGVGGDLPAEQLDFVQTIGRNGHHLLHLINELLDLTKIEAEQLTLAREPFDIAGLAAEVCCNLAPLAERGGVTLQAPVAAAMPVVADPQRIRQVLTNLVSNALKFTPAGGQVRLSLAVEARAVAVRVHDTGIGIAAADRERIFEPFVSLEGSSLQQGTGLGLPLAKKLVELHGGRLWLESPGGAGAIFGFSIPVAAAAVGR